MGKEFNHRVIHISLSFKIILFSFILLTGSVFAFNFDNTIENISDDSIPEFSFGVIQLASATNHTPTYADVTGFTSTLVPGFDGTNYSTAFDGTVTTSANIPQSPDSYISSTLAFGYAWTLQTDTIHAAIAMIHVSGVDPSGSSVWHTHTATLDSTSDCAGVGSGRQLINLQAPADAQITISNNSLNLWILNSPGFNPYQSVESFQLLEPTPGVLCLAAP